MTEQEMFNKAYLGILKQGSLCTDKNGLCTYYDEHTGHRCAVGHVVGEDAAKYLVSAKIGLIGDLLCLVNLEKLNDKRATNLFDRFWDVGIFLQALQAAHDDAAGMGLDIFKENMTTISRQYGLKVPRL